MMHCGILINMPYYHISMPITHLPGVVKGQRAYTLEEYTTIEGLLQLAHSQQTMQSQLTADQIYSAVLSISEGVVIPHPWERKLIVRD